MKPLRSFFLCALLPGVALAQDDILLMRPDEKAAVQKQSEDFNVALTPALQTAAESTVRVWVGMRRSAYGTVVGDGKTIVTKWSEIATKRGEMRVEGANSELRSVTVKGVYPEEDLAVLEVEGDPLTPIRWFRESPTLGTFIAASMPDGRLAAFGVVSVLERNLRDTDQAYLGVYGQPGFEGPGVKIAELDRKSGAAQAGLKAGDIILKIGSRDISGLSELKNALTGTQPGERVKMLLKSGDQEKIVEVVLGNRPQFRQMGNPRLAQMERMGGDISQVRGSFSRAIQTDMRIVPNQVGGPVVDLHGRALGITLARADRTRSFVMPAAALEELLIKTPVDPSQARAQLAAAPRDEPRMTQREPGQRRRPQVPPPHGPRDNSEERLRRHLSDMKRLMDLMSEEMREMER
ncbi:MAG: PDZ domain-containing protein [Luteolibacter sp.]